MTPAWQSFVSSGWPCLSRHGRLCVPAELGHPRDAGLEVPWLAEDDGQVGDWVAPLPDGSRLHVHEYADGSLVAHRDAADPTRSALLAARHLVGETRVGRLLFATVAALGASAAVHRWVLR